VHPLPRAHPLLLFQGSFHTHDPAAASSFSPTYMQQPSAVHEMAMHKGLLFVLLQSGLCPVFDTTTCELPVEASGWSGGVDASQTGWAACAAATWLPPCL
jgi:hypothetical protein